VEHCDLYPATFLKQKVMERTNPRTYRMLFNNTVSVVFFKYNILHTLVSMLTSPTLVTVIKQWVQLWNLLLYVRTSTTSNIRKP
jgi:hypothetical protein